MDPVSALGVAGNVLQFVDFTEKFISKALHIYKSADGASKDRRALENLLKDFILVNTRLWPRTGALPIEEVETNTQVVDNVVKCLIGHSTVLTHCGIGSNATRDPIPSIANNCSNIANQLVQRLEQLKVKGKRKAWASLKAALADLWKASELEEMQRSLDMHKQQLEFHVLISLRESLDLLSNRQADQFNSLKTSMRDTIQELLQNEHIDRTPAAAATNITPGVVAELAEQHEQIREKIIDAIHQALEARDLKGFQPSSLVQASVITTAANEYSFDLLAAEKDLLDSLKFPVMLDREEEIPEAERATFDWIFQEPKFTDLPWSNFSKWLRGEDSIYWITGKAGSGKSTLMKYLFCHSSTRIALINWAGRTGLVIAGFFFWNTGSRMQKTQEGLLRSLLYQILSTHRELIPVVLSDMTRAQRNEPGDVWTLARLKNVFGKLIRQEAVPIKICLFIDGLDEYSGDHLGIAEFFQDVALADNIKVCVSSRPLVIFERAFKSLPGLMLQNLTFNDISIYVENKLSDNAQMLELQKEEPQLASRFASEIINKAAGVFLWVKLVVRSLLEGLGSYDRGSDLERRLRELPEDLEELYWHMLKSVKPAFYLEQASKLLQIVYRAHKPLTILQLAYADIEDPDTVFQAQFNSFSETEQLRMCTMTEGRLKTRCLGLLELPSSRSSSSDARAKQVQFMHQSVADFLQTKEVQSRMAISLRDQLFSPHICLMKACILELKNLDTELFPHRQPAIVLAQIWYQFAWPIIRHFVEYAEKAESDTKQPQMELVEELDRVADYLCKLYVAAECRYDVSTDVHWSERRRLGSSLNPVQRNGSMISFAVELGLFRYVCEKLRLCQSSKFPKKPSSSQVKYALLVEEAGAQHRNRTSALSLEVRDKLLKAQGYRFKPFTALNRAFGTKRTDSLSTVIRTRHR